MDHTGSGGAIHAAIAHLESAEQQLVAHLAATRDALTTLRAVGGVPTTPVPAAKVERRQKPAVAPRGNGKPGSLTEEAVIAALKNGPLAPSELGEQLNASRYVLRGVLDTLSARGAVIVSGTTNSRRVALPGAPGKEAPQR